MPILWIPSTGKMQNYPRSWHIIDTASMYRQQDHMDNITIIFTGHSVTLAVDGALVQGITVIILVDNVTSIGYIYRGTSRR